MNFFGHAVAACWRSDDPAFVLGAMLPDFASMCRGKLSAVGDTKVAAGIEFHHSCDQVFHRAPLFRELMRWLELRLRARSVHRGGARGAAHVGVELLLDGALLDDPAARRAYPEALAYACAGQLDLHWREPDEHARWTALAVRLAEHGLPIGYADPLVVATRVVQILAGRPLLALDETEAAVLAEVMIEANQQVRSRAEPLCAYVRARVPMRQQR